jgi:hypothetical protein
MKALPLATLMMLLCLTPLQAQDSAPAPEATAPEATAPQDAPPKGDLDQGTDLIEEGAKLLLRGLLSEVEPALKDMEQALGEMEPALRDLMEMLGDIRNYDPPVRLPNGDILIRRKTAPDSQIDL